MSEGWEHDRTLDPARSTWVPNADDGDFPIQNLPLGVFSKEGESHRQIGWRIGAYVLAAPALLERGWLESHRAAFEALQSDRLNAFMALPSRERNAVRGQVSDLLWGECPDLRDAPAWQREALLPVDRVQMHLPAHIGDYTDFYASRDHAQNVGAMFRPDAPLLPNYDWIPIAYHGRSSSIVPSGAPITRPWGQAEGSDGRPIWRASLALDYEQELALWIAGENRLGEPQSVAYCDEERIFGCGLLNDWSARDLQRWEYRPLGPFLGKNFATSVSPWIVTIEALRPFRCPWESLTGTVPLDYLQPPQDRLVGVDLVLETYLRTETMRGAGEAAFRLSQSHTRRLMWCPGQMVAHHVSNGCNLRPGDLIGSGTVSGPLDSQRGCLLERTWNGESHTPIALPNGETRRYLQAGDEVILRGFAQRPGAQRIGLGTCHGRVLTDRPLDSATARRRHLTGRRDVWGWPVASIAGFRTRTKPGSR